MIQLECGILPRIGRTGNNSKNFSNDIFKFGGVHDADNKYNRDVEGMERQLLRAKRDRTEKRNAWRREFTRQVEEDRWRNMAAVDEKSNQLLNLKKAQSRQNQHSKEYNPITLQYLPSQAAQKLLENDLKSIHRASVRSTRLYFKNNSFDPIKGQDISPENGFRVNNNLEFPRALIAKTQQTADILGQKLSREIPISDQIVGMRDIDNKREPVWSRRY